MTLPSRSVESLISALVSADANAKLAVERLNKDVLTEEDKITEEELIRKVVSDPGSLGDQFRVKLMLTLYRQLNLLNLAIMGTISEMDADKSFKYFSNIATVFGQLTNKPLESAVDEPLSIIDARQQFADRLAKYQNVKDSSDIKEAT